MDSGRGAAGGNGTFDRPYVTLSEAQRSSLSGDVIFVAEALTPYEGGIALKEGQMLVGSAYGLDAVRVELKIDLDAPPLPAATGSGPLIHGTIMLAGNNTLAGVTIALEGGTGIVAYDPRGPLTILDTYIHPSRSAAALFIRDNTDPIAIRGGAIDGVGSSSGVFISGGRGDILFERFPISGIFFRAVDIRDRKGGSVTFRDRTAITVSDASGDAVVVQSCDGGVSFESPIRLTTHGGRGLLVSHAGKLSLSGGVRIDSTNAAAMEIRDTTIHAAFQSVSASAMAPGHLADGVVLDRIRGPLVIAPPEGEHDAGTIRGASRSGIAITQSSGIAISGMSLIDNGAGAKTKCEENIASQTNLLCRSALFLGHVTDSEFADLKIEGGGQVGINANNVSGLRMSRIQINRVGNAPFEAGIVVDEIIGEVRLSDLHIGNNGGGGLIVEQHYNDGRILIDGCTIEQTDRPELAPFLIRARTAGDARLALELSHHDLHDNAGSGIALEAGGRSVLRFSLIDSTAGKLGGSALQAEATENGRIALVLRNLQVVAPGIRSLSMISARIRAAAGTRPSVCFDATGNRFVTSGGGAPLIHLAVESTTGSFQVARGSSPSEGEGAAALLERLNPGATVRIDPPEAATAALVERCP